MKFGFHPILAEYVDAIAIDYEQCKKQQICCPFCRELIFKVHRFADSEEHYFAHRHHDLSYQSDCDLRAKKTTRKHIDSVNAESRGQKLALVLRVLREAIEAHDPLKLDESEMGSWKQIKKSKALRVFKRVFLLPNIRKAWPEYERFLVTSVDHWAGVVFDNSDWKPGFSLSIQKRIAIDIFKSLITKPSEENLNWLFDRAFLMILSTFDTFAWRENHEKENGYMHACLKEILRVDKNHGMLVFRKMLDTKIPDSDRRRFDEFFERILMEMFSSVVRTDWLKVLKEEAAQ